MEKKVKVRDKEYTVKELKYIQLIELDGLPKPEVARKMLKDSLDMTDEEVDSLTLKEGLELDKVIREVNDLNSLDFQKPTVEKTN